MKIAVDKCCASLSNKRRVPFIYGKPAERFIDRAIPSVPSVTLSRLSLSINLSGWFTFP